MDSGAFATWRAEIGFLTTAQRRLAFFDLALAEADDPIERRDDEIGETAQPDEKAGAAVARIVEEKPEPELLSKVGRDRIAGLGCPHCGDFSIGAWGRANGMPRYRCKACRKTFTPLTGTPLSGLHYKDRWIDQARALICGESIAKAAERCAIDHTTAFRWRHRFLSALNQDKPKSLSGIVEADETFILESFKGQHKGLPRPSRKRGGKGQQTRPVGGTNPRHRRARPNRRHTRRGLAAARRSQSDSGARRGHGPFDGLLLRWRIGHHSVRAARQTQYPRSARAGQSATGGAGISHQQRERLPWPTEGMAPALPRRRHQEPFDLPELAKNDGGSRGRHDA